MKNISFQTENKLIKELEDMRPMTFNQLTEWLAEKHPRMSNRITTKELRKFALENGIKILN